MRYTDEQLIEILQNFYDENNCYPTRKDFYKSNDLPNIVTIQKHFGCLNNALDFIKVPIIYPKNECQRCGGRKGFYKWCYDGDIKICHTCNLEIEGFNVNNVYEFGKLNKFLVEEVLKMNLIKVNVSGSALIKRKNRNDAWCFSINRYDDLNILIAYSENKLNIEHVWILSNDLDIFGTAKTTFNVVNTKIGLKEIKEFEFDTEMFNEKYHSIKIINNPASKEDAFPINIKSD